MMSRFSNAFQRILTFSMLIGLLWSNNTMSSSVDQSPYDSAQFLGFSIFTGPSYNPEECQAIGKESQCYLGLDDLVEDTKRRASVMRDAVNRAYAHANQDPHVLKVFIAPEFFWRGPEGAYPASSILDPVEITDPALLDALESEYQLNLAADPDAAPDREFRYFRISDAEGLANTNPINLIGRELESIVKDRRFRNWLFVFGTVIAINDFTAEYQGDEKLFYNFAPIYQGGDSGNEKFFLATKEYISSIDFIANPNKAREVSSPYRFGRPDQESKYDDTAWATIQDWLREKGYQLIQNNWFQLANIPFSIEICLDHLLHTARTNALRGNTPSAATISLVTSAGMNPKEGSFVLSDQGHLFLQDGLNTGSYEVNRVCQGNGDDGLLNCDFEELNSSEDIKPTFPDYSNAKCKRLPCAGTEYLVYQTEDEYVLHMENLFPMEVPAAIRVFDVVSIRSGDNTLSGQ